MYYVRWIRNWGEKIIRGEKGEKGEKAIRGSLVVHAFEPRQVEAQKGRGKAHVVECDLLFGRAAFGTLLASTDASRC